MEVAERAMVGRCLVWVVEVIVWVRVSANCAGRRTEAAVAGREVGSTG
jgi:hypothetical protein